MMNVYIGYDSREKLAFHVLAHSILERSSEPVAIHPLVQRQLRNQDVYGRVRDAKESTEFSLTRFLVPYLSGYKGFSVFMDCDMLCLTDIADLFMVALKARLLSEEKAVWVCKHDYTPISQTKFLGQQQTIYPRKNWSSLILFNNERCKALTPEHVNNASGLDLHRFHWLKDEDIGCLPLEWNWLVDEYPHRDVSEINMLHYTLGGPWFADCRDCDYAEEWLQERDRMS